MHTELLCLNSSSGVGGWIARTTYSSGNLGSQGIVVNKTSGKIYQALYQYNTGLARDYTAYLCYTSSGSVSFNASAYSAGFSLQPRCLSVLSSDEVYVNAGQQYYVLFSSTGTPTSGRNGDLVVFDMCLDSSPNVYIGGYIGFSNPAAVWGKLTTTGSFSWARTFNKTGTDIVTSLDVDNSANLYAAGGSESGQECFLFKYDTSGTLQWTRLGNTTLKFNQSSVACFKSSGNLYVCGMYSNGTTLYLVKLNTSGTQQWCRTVLNTNVNEQVRIALDDSENVYVCCTGIVETTPSSVNGCRVFKYNSSGSLQWQRSVKLTESTNDYRIAVDSGTFFYLGFDQTSASAAYAAKFPADGTGTGSYTISGVTLTYSATSLTETSGSLTYSSSSPSISSTTITSSSGYPTSSSTSLNTTTVAI